MKPFQPRHYLAVSAAVMCALFASPAPSRSQTTTPPSSAIINALPLELQTRIERALNVPALRNATVGFLVRAPDTNRTLYERNADLALLPASNQKILTAVGILQKLGVKHTFVTTVLRAGEVDADGTLRGDLYLRGSGDPSLTSERLLELARAVRNAGIRKVVGRIIGDGSVFDETFLGVGWQWDDEPFGYSAQVGGLNCDENTVALDVSPGGSPGEPARVRVGGANALRLGFLGTSYVRVRSSVTTGGLLAVSNVSFDRTRGRNEFLISGMVRQGGPIVSDELTIENPNLFTTTRLAEMLPLAGVRIEPNATMTFVGEPNTDTGRTPENAVVIAETQSRPLGEMVRQFMKVSDNLFGECFLKTIGNGKSADGAARLADMLRETLGVDTLGLNTADGSGLSRFNTVTARLLVQTLSASPTKLATDNYKAFYDALPIAGLDGTLRNRFKETPLAGNLRAKTGNLSGVTALSGTFRTRAGERLVFSFLINNFVPSLGTQARRAMDEAITVFYDLPRSR